MHLYISFCEIDFLHCPNPLKITNCILVREIVIWNEYSKLTLASLPLFEFWFKFSSK